MALQPQHPTRRRRAASGPIRPAFDAGDVARLPRDPADPSGKLDVELDASFPASDPPSQTQPER
jgi:hypothetical protein